MELIRAGRVRVLAVTAAMRWQGLPDVPTVGEFVPSYELATWAGVGAPRATPAGIVDQINSEINAALASPDIMKKFVDLGTVLAISPVEFGKLVADDVEKWAKVIKFVASSRAIPGPCRQQSFGNLYIRSLSSPEPPRLRRLQPSR